MEERPSGFILNNITDYKYVYDNIIKNLKIYIQENNIKALVLGVSGGIDSTVCALLAKEACEELDIPLIGRNIYMEDHKKYNLTKEFVEIKEYDETDTAEAIGNLFCTYYSKDFMTKEFNVLWEYMGCVRTKEENHLDYKIRRGNIMARLRMIYLYDIAKRYKGMVLSTDNLTEYYLGFWTLHGDVGDYGMIQELWKTEVYELAKWIAENIYSGDKHRYNAIYNSINKTPTDGLGITKNDFEQIGGKSYDDVDVVLRRELKNIIVEMGPANQEDQDRYINRKYTSEELKIIERFRKTHFKRNNPINITRINILSSYDLTNVRENEQ